MWSTEQIENHRIAGEKLGLLKDEFNSFVLESIKLKKNVTEKDCLEFIKKAYKKHGLVNDNKKEFAIVAFGENTKEVHYFPSSTSNRKLKTGDLVLLDMWARLEKKEAPYSDVTFMFYAGKIIPKEVEEVWTVLIDARDTAVRYIKKEIKKGIIPRGLDIDRVAHDVIGKAGFGKGIKHTVGHSLGFDSPHGKLPGINWREYSPILKNVGYTIEPGIYLKNFGMRTEIDFYINTQNKVVATTPTQEEIEII